MPTFTVSMTGPGDLVASEFEQMLDVLPAAAMEGDESSEVATLWFDVRARSRDAAVETAWLRAQALLRNPHVATLIVARSIDVEGRRPWWRRVLAGR